MEKKSPKQKGLNLQKQLSAGGVVYKKNNNKVYWLVAKSTPSAEFPKTFWRLQKGWLDDEDSGKSPGPLARGEKRASESELQQAAVREVAEEGGVIAGVIKKIGTERYFYSTAGGTKILKFVTFYLMEWQKNIPEGPGFETSEIKWLEYKDARKTLTHSGERKILDRAKGILDSGIQNSLL